MKVKFFVNRSRSRDFQTVSDSGEMGEKCRFRLRRPDMRVHTGRVIAAVIKHCVLASVARHRVLICYPLLQGHFNDDSNCETNSLNMREKFCDF